MQAFDGEMGHVHEIRVLDLTRNELLFIDDTVTMMMDYGGSISSIRNQMPTIVVPMPEDFVLRLAEAILLADKTRVDETTPLTVTIDELYTIREISQSYVKIGSEYIGYSLKLKVFRALLEQQDQEVEDPLERLLEGIDIEQEELASLQELQDETSHEDSNR